jgi:hypothetical protein
MKNTGLPILLLMSLLIGCGKGSHNGTPPTSTTGTSSTSKPASTVDMYLVGDYSNFKDSVGAAYWKNDTVTILSGGIYADANAITVSGTDIYTAGLGNSASAYWKDGNITTLPHGFANDYASCIALNGQDVNVAGVGINAHGNPQAWYWNKGNSTLLSADTNVGYCYNMAISNNDVYITGIEYSLSNSIIAAKYWKNGVSTTLSNPARTATASDIYITGSDIYVSGAVADSSDEHLSACYWKNGTMVILSDSSGIGEAGSIAMSGSDLYIVGSKTAGSLSNPRLGNAINGYWKNGVFTALTDSSMNYRFGNIAVMGTDVYVPYWVVTPNGQILTGYFKNDQQVQLVDGVHNTGKVYRILFKNKQ